jgi:hypothetical protein
MTPVVVTPAEGMARPTRLPRIARKLSAISLLAVALSIVRPAQMHDMHHRSTGRVALWTAPPTDDLRPAPQVALLYSAHDAGTGVSVDPMPRSHLLGSLVRQVV